MIPPQSPLMAESSRLVDIAYAHILGQVLSGTLAPGTRLVTRRLASDIGCSLNPVREALGRLKAEGLIEQVPGAGAFVHAPTLQEIDDLYDYREAIEPHAARRAAQFITGAQLNRLRHMCDDQQSMIERMNASGKAASGALLNDWLNADVQFHLQIIEASRNRYMMRAVSESRLLSRVFMLHRDLAGLVTANSSATTYAAHVDLVDALARGDQDAAAAMVLEQIQLGRQSVISKASG